MALTYQTNCLYFVFMSESLLSWNDVNESAIALGVNRAAREKWRSRGVPYSWRIQIIDYLAHKNKHHELNEFDKLVLWKLRPKVSNEDR